MNALQRIKYKNIALLFGCAIFFASCEEDLAKVNAANKKVDFPSQIIKNANIIQRDSGLVKLRAKAPLIEEYQLIDTPYIVARKGIDIEFFDKKKPKTPGTLKADFAKITEMKKFYEAKGNVKIKTNEGQLFASQSFYWDQNKREIFTRDTVYVTNTDGSTQVSVNGMIAKDDFSKYTFYNNSGQMAIPENSK